jgi:valyl-tRNA synthetase
MKNIIESSKEYYSFLAQVSEIEFTDLDDIKDSVALLLEGAKFFIPLDDLIDYKKELDRLNKEKIKFEQELERAKSKLTNESFISKAPQKLIDEEKAKVEKFISILKETSDRIESIKNKA